MHTIQQHVLDLLLAQSPRRYAELKPTDVEGNVFTHHLRQLIKGEFVVQQEPGRYALGKFGRKLAGNISSHTGEVRSQQKILVEVALRNKKGEWLLFERAREPYRTFIGFPAGRRHAGETLRQAAERDIYEKTDIHPDLKFAGTLSFTVYAGEELFNFVETHIFVGKADSPTLKEEGILGKPLWQDLRGENLNSHPYFPGLAEVYAHITEETCPFFNEYRIDTNPSFETYSALEQPLSQHIPRHTS